MPTYDYRCVKCGDFEKYQSIKDDALTSCPTCGSRVQRLISRNVGLIFKGSGFYVTDNRSNSSRSAAKADTGASSSSSSSADSNGKTAENTNGSSNGSGTSNGSGSSNGSSTSNGNGSGASSTASSSSGAAGSGSTSSGAAN